ncbi:MAG: glycoside hydrolase family 3 N-terminal domain-containing protein, partial [Bacteroidota bacterium]|nr:glycoside hydrolase family 3 N-terminal domain-containing protein [Bacteroidota bacterium]
LFFSCTNQNLKSDIDQKVDDIISQMTLEEKVGQMTQINLTVIAKGPNKWESSFPMEIDDNKANRALVEFKVGSVLNTINNTAQKPNVWFNNISKIQDIAMNKNRLGIPVIYGIDAIHGTTYTDGATMFPQQITTAASWNPENAYNMALVCAYETRASSIPWNFSPVLDLGLDPRFSRQFETFGEDPLLVERFGVEMIKGYQGLDNDISNKYNVAACMKHFVGYHATISGKDRTPAYIPDNVLSEYHIEPFKKAIDAGAKTIMINSGLINGIPVHADYNLMINVLRNNLGFEGVILTDWEDIRKLHDRDKVAETQKEAVKMAINAGIDMSMVPYEYEQFFNDLVQLVNEGEVSMERIDDAVKRILKLKFELDLFENPVTNYEEYEDFGSKKHHQLAYKAASESITLLKNNNDILPLKGKPKILVTGPNGNNMRTLNGAWSYSWQGELTDRFAGDFNTIYEALQNNYGRNNVKYVSGVSYKENGSYYDMVEDNINAVVREARNSDYIVLCLGENTYTEKPGDLNDLNLHQLQVKLAKKLAETGKPIILILNLGRPRLISDIEPLMSAVVNVYLPGNFGGDALSDIISGDVNPSGKLPYTYPAYPNSLLPYYYKPSEVQNNAQGAYNYVGEVNNLYDFGFGLSYSEFIYSDLKVNKDQFGFNETIQISVNVENISEIDGFETIQLYSSDLYASVTPDIKRLRDFSKVEIKAGEKKTITFDLPVDELAFVNADNQLVVEPGNFKLTIDRFSKEISVR